MKPSVSIAYLAVVLIWSTTPLGIVWSSKTVHPTMAVLIRMVIAIVLGTAVIYWKRIPFPWDKLALRLYCYSALGIFGGMLLVYMAANYIASGTISLIFGLAPVISGWLSVKILGDNQFSVIRRLALLLAIAGLAIVFTDGLSLGWQKWPGYIYILGSVFFFSLSTVLVKSVHLTINPIATTIGALLISLPFFVTAWLVMDGTLPYQSWSVKSIAAIIYLGVFGSLIGFVAYYYVLQYLAASTVALVTLMTPIMAMIFGASLNDESITMRLIAGAITVMSGLFLYHFGEKYFLRKKTD